MRYLLQFILVIVFFILPVYLDFLQVNMYTYLMLGLESPFPAPLITILVFAAALCLVSSILLGKGKINQGVMLVSLIVLLVPVVMIMSRQGQFNSVLSTIRYTVFFVLLITCGVLLFRNKREIVS